MTITHDTPNPQAVLTDEDLHARLYARYRETIAESRRLDGLPFGSVPQEEADAAHDAYWQAFKELVETPTETLAGLLIVASVLAEDIVPQAAAWEDNINVTAARTVRDGIARLAASDDMLVATWAEWRKGWLAYKEGDDIVAEGNRLGDLERIIVNTPAHGLRGIAVKAGQAIWYAFTKQDMEARGGFLSQPEDMDWDIQCSASFALDLERLTGIPVHPRWDLEAKPAA